MFSGVCGTELFIAFEFVASCCVVAAQCERVSTFVQIVHKLIHFYEIASHPSVAHSFLVFSFFSVSPRIRPLLTQVYL